MVLTLRHNPTLIALAFLLAVGLSYFSIRAALASHCANRGTLEGYERATRLEPSNPENWWRLGDSWQNDLQNGDPQRAIAAYRTALSLDSKSVQAWLGLASAYEGQGKLDAANKALLSAKRAYPISADVSWRYANFLLRKGELNPAFDEARQALENEPQRAWGTFALFQRFDSDVDELLNRLLPRHQTVYLDVIWGLDAEGRPSEALKVWDRLFELDREIPQRRVPTGTYQVTSVIVFSLVDQLLAKGYIREARRVWDEVLAFMNLSQQRDARESLVWDGGFENDLSGGFSWRIDSPSGSLTRFTRMIKHSGARALEITFDGKHNVDFHGVCQFVAVEPDTTYDFSAWLRTENITTDRGIFLRLSAPQDRGPQIVTPELTGTHPWTKVGFRWKTSKNMHLLQICVMRVPSYNAYNTIAGTVWVDDVRLVPIEAVTGPF
jgi:tetratricopeptide (TPR) repeat protein